MTGRTIGFLCHLTAMAGADVWFFFFFFCSEFVPIQSVAFIQEVGEVLEVVDEQ